MPHVITVEFANNGPDDAVGVSVDILIQRGEIHLHNPLPNFHLARGETRTYEHVFNFWPGENGIAALVKSIFDNREENGRNNLLWGIVIFEEGDLPPDEAEPGEGEVEPEDRDADEADDLDEGEDEADELDEGEVEPEDRDADEADDLDEGEDEADDLDEVDGEDEGEDEALPPAPGPPVMPPPDDIDAPLPLIPQGDLIPPGDLPAGVPALEAPEAGGVPPWLERFLKEEEKLRERELIGAKEEPSLDLIPWKWPLWILLLLHIYLAITLQTIAKKTGTPNRWFAWIPITNLYLMCKIAGRPGWWILLFLVPLVNIIIVANIWMRIAAARNKPAWLGLLLLIPIINLILPGYLAFSK